MGERLKSAGIADASGFALNVSNFYRNAENIAYGEQVSRLVGGKHFIIDNSRNGNGSSNGEWCNPRGRALGSAPTVATGHRLVDAFLWIKRPGESDGACTGGPQAGQWWGDYALDLAKRQPASLAANN
jgi:endoglucanase